MKTLIICVAALVSMLELTAAVSTAGKGVMLMNRIGPSSADLFIANGDGSGERRLLQSPGFDYDASFSSDGQWIVFTSERAGAGQADIYRVRRNGSSLERLTDSPALDDQAALSPDNTQLAFVSTREMHTANIWVLDIKSRKSRNLTGGADLQTPGKPDGFFRPSWSPDGQWIAFSSDRGTEYRGHERGAGAGHTQALSVYIIRADGTGVRRITPPGIGAGTPKWSADGKRLVVYEMDPALTFVARLGNQPPPGQIVSIDLATGTRTEHTSGPGLKISPQFLGNDRIAYLVKSAPAAGPVAGLAFTTGEKSAAGPMRSPSWSADGQAVVYHRFDFINRGQNAPLYSWDPDFEYQYTDVFPTFSRDRKLAITDLNFPRGNPDASVSVMDPDGSNRKRVFHEANGAALMPSWSPDGQWFVVGFGGFFGAREAAPGKLIMVRTDGSEMKELTSGPLNSGFPSWSPDGKRIVYRVWGGDARGLRVLNLDDHSVATLTNEWDNFPAWSPGGDRILFTRQRSTDQDFDIYTIRPDGSDLRQVTRSPGADGHATWTADGKQIFVASARTGFKDEAALYDNSPQPYAQIFLMDSDGSHPRKLTDSRWEDSMPVYVPAATSASSRTK